MKTVFMSGIAGTGMSALAGLFRQKGFRVIGSDSHFYPPIGPILERMGIGLFTGYSEKNIPPEADFCIIGNVICRGNPEAEHILNSGLPYCSMAEALYRYFICGHKSIVVAGSHGKTTITSFVAHMLEKAGLAPGFFIGGKPLDFSGNSRMAGGEYFVAEGDEYDTAFFDRSSKFLKYFPRFLILTALEYDHLDIFPSEGLYMKSFQDLVDQVPANGRIIANGDFPMARRVLEKSHTPVVFFGRKNGDVRIDSVETRDPGFEFTLELAGRKWAFRTRVAGRYNVWNLTAGIVLGFHLGIDPVVIGNAVESFSGVERRMTSIRAIGRTMFIEDFAHHPTAIHSVLESLKETDPGKKIVAIFEPRSWSMRRNFFQQRIASSFAGADEVAICDVYEKEKIPDPERLDVHRMKVELEAMGKKSVVFADYQEIRTYLRSLDFDEARVVVLLSNGGFGNLAHFIRYEL